jgi:hypothetical protein
LATLEERVSRDGVDLTIFLEPAGLSWLMGYFKFYAAKQFDEIDPLPTADANMIFFIQLILTKEGLFTNRVSKYFHLYPLNCG